jgi:hypothetical protein
MLFWIISSVLLEPNRRTNRPAIVHAFVMIL